MNDQNERDELFRNRIKTALHQLNGQLNGFDSDASLEAQLAEIDTEPHNAVPLEEPEVSRIMQQVHSSIHAAARHIATGPPRRNGCHAESNFAEKRLVRKPKRK